MNQTRITQNPLVRLLGVLGALLLLAFSIFVGTILLTALLGVFALITFVLYVRYRLLRHRLRKRYPGQTEQQGTVIEGEYTVEHETRHDKQPRDKR